MHELSVARSIVAIVKESLAGSEPVSVKSVKVRVGALSGVVPDSLEFSFAAIVDGTELHGARLDIERTKVIVHCPNCLSDSVIDGIDFTCPKCGGSNTGMISGNELSVVQVEFDDERTPRQ